MTKWITCQNGHRYDPSLTSECPECAVLKRFTAPLQKAGSWGKELPRLVLAKEVLTEQRGPAKPVPAEARENSSIKLPVLKAPSAGSSGIQADHRSEEQTEEPVRPVTGWLVCVEGAERGIDYRLHQGNNLIGSSAEGEICVSQDQKVVRDPCVVISYNNKSNQFFAAPVGGMLVYLKDNVLLRAGEIVDGDRIQIGQNTFLFAALCGERFQWKQI